MSLCQIRILDAATANKIAAGEVIERPASVVKELIENSIDAGAKNIGVEVFQGGINEIIVTDDGQGIPGDQIKVAFKRHATSKIRTADDLFCIKTYGFRGEALPSIASVSRVTVVTRTAEDHLGSRYIIEGGLDVLFEETACNTGTCISVKDLFFNVSPRKKQLKSITKEAGHVAHVVAAMALGNPHISFKYSHNKKLIFQSAGKGVLENNIVNVLGIDLFKNLIPVNHGNFDNDEGLSIGGYISKPQYTRAANHNQYLYVNKRWVYSSIINRAVAKAYTTLIPSERYPIYILSLNIPYHIVDVNVHPTKKQIKFDNDELVEDFVLKALKSALRSLDSIFVQKPKIEKNTFKEIGRQVEFNWETIGIKADEKNYKEKNSTELDFNKIRETEIAYNEYRNNEINEIKPSLFTKNLVENSNESNDITLKVSYPKLKPLEQIDGSYIIAVDGQQKGFYIIDQHAAHERIHYESLKHARDNDSIKSQLLLNSEVIDLTPAEKDFLLENMLLLQNAGFTLEYFGDNTFLLRGVPIGLESGTGVSVIKDMLDNYLKQNEKPSWAKLIKMVACKAAITAKKNLSKDEMESLLEKLSKTDVPYTCPHGRPTTVHVTNEELIKRFHR
ncbi:MAG: DNA mismatch repair endonuclease MutL [Clostridia bacterium]|nr:DNA mismatch repair endonuclease MutL [Clostridia bacterium]